MKDGLSATEEMSRKRKKTLNSVNLNAKQNLKQIRKNILQTNKQTNQ